MKRPLACGRLDIRQCSARTILNWCNTVILDCSQDHTTAEDDSTLKTSTTDQSTVHPSYNHWMYVINHLFKAAFKKPNAKCVASGDHQMTHTRKINELNNQPTNQPTAMSTERIPHCKANSLSISQEFPHTLWDQQVHHCAQKIQPSVPGPIHISPVHVSNPATTLLYHICPGWDTNRPCD
jgi:hypothetical protein